MTDGSHLGFLRLNISYSLVLTLHSVTSNYLENMYHNTFYDKKFLGYGQGLFPIMVDCGHLIFQDTACVFEYFLFYGPVELLFQRGPLHHDLSTCLFFS